MQSTAPLPHYLYIATDPMYNDLIELLYYNHLYIAIGSLYSDLTDHLFIATGSLYSGLIFFSYYHLYITTLFTYYYLLKSPVYKNRTLIIITCI